MAQPMYKRLKSHRVVSHHRMVEPPRWQNPLQFAFEREVNTFSSELALRILYMWPLPKGLLARARSEVSHLPQGLQHLSGLQRRGAHGLARQAGELQPRGQGLHHQRHPQAAAAPDHGATQHLVRSLLTGRQHGGHEARGATAAEQRRARHGLCPATGHRVQNSLKNHLSVVVRWSLGALRASKGLERS